MKKIFFILIVVCAHFKFVAQSFDKAILDFTKKNYLSLIADIPEKNLLEYGFNSQSEIKDLKFHTVIAEYILIDNIPTKTGNYRIIAATKKGATCGLFTVSIKNNKMQVVDYGAKELASKIVEKQMEFTSTSHVSLLRIFSTQTDYLFDDNLETKKQLFFKIYDSSVRPLHELLTPLK